VRRGRCARSVSAIDVRAAEGAYLAIRSGGRDAHRTAAGTALRLPALTALPEKFLNDFCGAPSQYAALDDHLMIEARVIYHL